MAKNWANGLPNDDRSPKTGHRMAAEGMPFPWRGNGSTISTDLDVIWGMSDKTGSPPPCLSNIRCVFEKTAVTRLHELWQVRRCVSVLASRREAV